MIGGKSCIVRTVNGLYGFTAECGDDIRDRFGGGWLDEGWKSYGNRMAGRDGRLKSE